MPSAPELAQGFPRLFRCCRLIKPVCSADQQLIGADHESAGMPYHHGLSLTLCQVQRRLFGSRATAATVAFDYAFIDIRRILFEPDSSGSENASACFASRRKDDTNPKLT
jgi:hypothetical protein